MTDFVQEEPDNGEELIDEEGLNRTQQEMDGEEPGPAAPSESDGWDETNDEPAQGEGQQDIV
jgi:hypothetical protein